MGFGQLKVKAKAKSGRGSLDAAGIEEAVNDSWDLIQDAVSSLDEAVQQQIKDHFNELI